MGKTKLYTFYMGLYGATTRIQNGISGSYMDAVLAHVESENLIDKSTSQFYQGRLTALLQD